MDFCNLTKRNIDELLHCDTNAMYSVSDLNTLDDKTDMAATGFELGPLKLGLHSAAAGATRIRSSTNGTLGPGKFIHEEFVAYDDKPINDSDVEPIVIQPIDSDVNSIVEIKPIEIIQMAEGGDFYPTPIIQEQATAHVCHNSDDKGKTNDRECAEISGKTVTVAVNYIDDNLITAEKIRKNTRKVTVDLAQFESPKASKDFMKVDKAFLKINTNGVTGVVSVKFEDTNELFLTEVKIENEASNVTDKEDRSLIGFDTTQGQVKNKPSERVSSELLLQQNAEKGSRKGKYRRKRSVKHSNSWKERRETYCRLCKRYFESKFALITHKKFHNQRRKHICQICRLRFSDTAHLKLHMRSHSTASYHPCGVCGLTFKTQKKLDTHAKRHKNEVELLTCEICGETGVRWWLQAHRYRRHKEFYFYECSKCGKHFTNQRSLLLHKGCEDKKPIACTVCNELFSSIHTLKHHMTLHEGEITHFCSLCGEGFTCWFYIDQHFKKVHPRDRCWECDRCEKKFRKILQLKRHQKIHSLDRPYPCNICNSRFEQKSVFEAHMRQHTG